MDYLPKKLTRANDVSGGVEEGAYYGRSYPSDWNKWAALLRAFTQNLVDTFGLVEIRTWYFEVWNEADGWPVADWPQIHRLYDVFVDTVTSVDTKLKVGGPGGHQPAFLRDFLEHAANGTNCVNGKKGSRIDFISYHIYGMSGDWLTSWPLVRPSVQRFVHEILWIQRVIARYPSLKGVPFHLNEWGVSSHYEKNSRDYPPLVMRDSEYSALFFIKLVDSLLHLQAEYGMETAMLLYWGFCAEDSFSSPFHGNRSLTTAGHVCKPIQTAHEIMALMGETFLDTGSKSHEWRTGGPLGIMAARNGEEYQLLVYHFDENDDGEFSDYPRSAPVKGEVTLNNFPSGSLEVECFVMDDRTHNTYRLWRRMGSPENLNETDIEALQTCGELSPQEKFQVPVKNGSFTLLMELAPQSIRLYQLKAVPQT
jgi:hypothetical protein